MKLQSLLGQLRLLAFLEGISFISFGITMPLKYTMDIKEPNFYVGIAHGVLFIGYCVWVLINHYDRQWKLKTSALLFIASLLPFGTFVADAKILKKQSNS